MISPAPHALPTAISCRSSPAAAVLAIRSGPQRISSAKGAPLPQASLPADRRRRAFVSQMPFAPEVHLDGALQPRCRGRDHLAVPRERPMRAATRPSIKRRTTFMCPSRSHCPDLYEERHGVKRRPRRLRPASRRVSGQARSPLPPSPPEAGASRKKLPATRAPRHVFVRPAPWLASLMTFRRHAHFMGARPRQPPCRPSRGDAHGTLFRGLRFGLGIVDGRSRGALLAPRGRRAQPRRRPITFQHRAPPTATAAGVNSFRALPERHAARHAALDRGLHVQRQAR